MRVSFYPSLLWLLICLCFSGYAQEGEKNPLDRCNDKRVEAIDVVIEHFPGGGPAYRERILSKMQTKVGVLFSQLDFDQDLKALSEEFDRVEPEVEEKDHGVVITLRLWRKPMIRSITWQGNRYITTGKLQKVLGVQPGEIFNRDEFNKAFTKVKELYVKKGFFESVVEYVVIPWERTNEVDIQFSVTEGTSGHVRCIEVAGVSAGERRKILDMIVTKRYNIFLSWLTGRGVYHEEALEHDTLVITHYLQNLGYANARVNIELQKTSQGNLDIYIYVEKGALFHFGTVTFRGQTIFSEEELRQVFNIKQGDPFSSLHLGERVNAVADFYGEHGYIKAEVNYSLHLSPLEPVYDVDIGIEEGEQFKVGLVHVLGNTTTRTKVILRETLLSPGEIFDIRRLKRTQTRLETVGYFQSVNVYAIHTKHDDLFGHNYRDVIIEVKEKPTGHAGIFGGIGSDIFCGVELYETNFDHRGLWRIWRHGFSALRGGGEYAILRLTLGSKQQGVSFEWFDPYLWDSRWRMGMDFSYTNSRQRSERYRIQTLGGSISFIRPLTGCWSFGVKGRASSSIFKEIEQDTTASAEQPVIIRRDVEREKRNSAFITACGKYLSYNSVDNPYLPYSGIRSSIQTEVATVRRHVRDVPLFPMLRLEYLNSVYCPLWGRSLCKLRFDLKFLWPLGSGSPDKVPIGERFFLGGETSVRGYRPYNLGPKFVMPDGSVDEDDPLGGISSLLCSVEYQQPLLASSLFLFVFFDGGSISDKLFSFQDFRTSTGIGLRFYIPNFSQVPIMIGYGYPINPGKYNKVQPLFFSMVGRF